MTRNDRKRIHVSKYVSKRYLVFIKNGVKLRDHNLTISEEQFLISCCCIMTIVGILMTISFTLPILYTRGPTYISYYLKFGVYYLSLCVLTLFYLPYIIWRGRTADDPDFILRCWRWIGKWIIGIQWEFTNSDVELNLLLRKEIKGGAVIGMKIDRIIRGTRGA